MKPRSFRIACSIVAALLSTAGVIHAVKAAVSHSIFFRVRYRSDSSVISEVLSRCEKAHALYPYNYGCSVFAANQAFVAGADADAGKVEVLMRESEKWCDRGLLLNSWDRRLRFRKMGLLARKKEMRPAAVALWEAHTDWEFWNPRNHYYLAVMHAWMGDVDNAERSLYWARGSKEYETARKIVEDAKARAK